jgi:FMN-dependent NADH-azoreductase
MNILHIDCSPRAGRTAASFRRAIVERILAIDLSASITRRDLGFEPIPHAEPDHAAVLFSPAAWRQVRRMMR